MKSSPTLDSRAHLRGLTTMELLTVVIIVAILAMAAIPQLDRMIERGHRREAIDILTTIYNGERAYYFTKSPVDARAYCCSPALKENSSNAAWGNIFMDNPNMGSAPVSFTVSAEPPQTGVAASFEAIASPSRPGKQMKVKVENEHTSWCGTLDAPAPTNLAGDSCDSAAGWPIP